MAKQKQQESKIDALRRRMEQTRVSGGEEFWKPKVGENNIRILPGVGDMDPAFWVDVGQHYVEGNSYFCLDVIFGEKCPFCEKSYSLYKAGDDGSKELAKEFRVRRSFWMNILDRKAPDRGVQIFTPGPTIFKVLKGLVLDPDYGDITDPEGGYDIKISRAGTGLDTEYEVLARPRPSKLAQIDGEIDELLEQAYDLTPVQLTEDPSEDDSLVRDGDGNVVKLVAVLPYGRLKEALEPAVEEEEEDEKTPFDVDGEEEENPVRKVIKQRRQARGR